MCCGVTRQRPTNPTRAWQISRERCLLLAYRSGCGPSRCVARGTSDPCDRDLFKLPIACAGCHSRDQDGSHNTGAPVIAALFSCSGCAVVLHVELPTCWKPCLPCSPVVRLHADKRDTALLVADLLFMCLCATAAPLSTPHKDLPGGSFVLKYVRNSQRSERTCMHNGKTCYALLRKRYGFQSTARSGSCASVLVCSSWRRVQGQVDQATTATHSPPREAVLLWPYWCLPLSTLLATEHAT